MKKIDDDAMKAVAAYTGRRRRMERAQRERTAARNAAILRRR
jgi:hypothetical protein